jgi:hypothetical protein
LFQIYAGFAHDGITAFAGISLWWLKSCRLWSSYTCAAPFSDAFTSQSFSASTASFPRKSLSFVQLLIEMRLLVSDGNLPFLTVKDEKYVIPCALVKLRARCCEKVSADFSGSNQYWARIKCLVCGEDHTLCEVGLSALGTEQFFAADVENYSGDAQV